MLFAFLTTLLFSVSAVTANRTITAIGSNAANALRLVAAAVLLGAWAWLIGNPWGGVAWGWFFLSGVIGFGFGDIGVFHALPRLGSRLTLLFTQCLAAPIAALAEWLWLGTTLTGAQLLLGATILGGIALALASGRLADRVQSITLAGVLFGVLAATGQGLGAVISRVAYDVTFSGGETIPGPVAAFQRILGGLLVAVVMFLIAHRAASSNTVTTATSATLPKRANGSRRWLVLFVALNALSGPVIGVSCYQWALEGTPSGIVLPIVALTPIVVIPLAFVFEKEIPSLRSLLGGLIAVAGSIGLALTATN